MTKTVDVRVRLTEDLVTSLDQLAQQRGIQRSALLREAIADYVRRAERQRIAKEMRDYVEVMATYSDEFVSETDAHTVERLLNETTW
jgi:metal-responsive CopG/Arc/MetJ family transcriptional regulator